MLRDLGFWGCGFLLRLGWVEGVEFEGVLGGRVERVGKMMGRWKNSKKWSPGDPFGTPKYFKVEPEALQSHPQIEKSDFFEGPIVFNSLLSKFAASFHDFWVPPGTPKFVKKTCFSRKWGSHDSYFSRYML